MTIPIYHHTWQEEPNYSAKLFLEALRARGWEPGAVPHTVVLTYSGFEHYLAGQTDDYTPNRALGTGPGRFFLVNATDGRVAINCLGTGPSATASQIELQAELGVERFVILGTAGGLDPGQSPGEIVVASSAVRDDGTSDHYAAPDAVAAPDASLFEAYAAFLSKRGLVPLRAPTWTTSAPFRTTAQAVGHYAAHGVRAVEEEVATLFIVGAAVRVATAAALVIDSVPNDQGGWRIDRAAAAAVLRELLVPTVEFLAS